jgi:TPR repeat protein
LNDDRVKAATQVEEAIAKCEKRDPATCELVAERQVEEARRRGLYEKENPSLVEARRLSEEACRLGASFSCLRIADLKYFGIGSPTDDSGFAQLEKGCRNFTASSGKCCLEIVELLEEGTDQRAKDSAKAAKLLQLACDGKNPAACNELGRALEKGLYGLATDGPRAAETYRQACALGDRRACARME